MNNSTTKNMTLTAMFLAIGMVLPFLTGQIQVIGTMLLPLHIPVFLCGLICGWKYGLACGLILPILRSAIFGMPPMFPQATAMAFELAAYGSIAGYLYNRSKWQCIWMLYKSMIAAMLGGRIVWGLAMTIFTSAVGGAFTWQAFMSAAFVTAVPGIILQLILIPAIMLLLDRTGLVTIRRNPAKVQHA